LQWRVQGVCGACGRGREMTEYRVVIPILNNRVTGLIGPPWQLSSEIAIETVLDEDHAAFLRDPPKSEGQQIQINAKVINVRVGEVRPSHVDVLRLAAVAQFCLNYFARDPGLCLGWGCTVAPGKRSQMSVIEFFDLAKAPIAPVARHKNFRFESTVKRSSLSGMHQAATRALNSFPGVMMSIDRFCRAMSRDDNHDRLVDLCIALESLIDGSNELRFRFSQLHAIVGERDLAKREAAFKLFQDFYDARSKVVHGDPAAEAKIAAVEARWTELLGYAKKSLAYYLAYLSGNSREDWNTHVRRICLGIESPGNGE
jgi:hypothetical protein